MTARAPCFGAEVAVYASGPGSPLLVSAAIEDLHEIDRCLSRFKPESELCRLNRDPGTAVPASPLMLEMVAAVGWAGRRSAGLVDGTLLEPLERAGYAESFRHGSRAAGGERPAPRPALPGHGWRDVEVDRARGLALRPPGVHIDSGGLGKGLAADRIGAAFERSESFCIDCAGDMLIGGAGGASRTVNVAHPIDGTIAHSFEVVRGGVATSGIARRAWSGDDGTARHHLIDPGRGAPAFTGVVQATALAPTALEAEVLAKAALLSGPELAPRWLPQGGVLVLDDGSVEPVAAVEPLECAVADRAA